MLHLCTKGLYIMVWHGTGCYSQERVLVFPLTKVGDEAVKIVYFTITTLQNLC